MSRSTLNWGNVSEKSPKSELEGRMRYVGPAFLGPWYRCSSKSAYSRKETVRLLWSAQAISSFYDSAMAVVSIPWSCSSGEASLVVPVLL